jgi:hypothetical protein
MGYTYTERKKNIPPGVDTGCCHFMGEYDKEKHVKEKGKRIKRERQMKK